MIRVEKKHKTYSFAKFYHVGIYLGNNEVCHIYDYGEEK
jgi:cell wall-associated NlpC family hydrolase